MKKRLLSIILTAFLVLSMVPYAAFADDSIVCPACGGTVEKHSFHLVGNYWDFFKCNTCGKWAYLSGITGLKLFSAGDQQILNSADANGILNFAFNDGHLITAKVAPSGIGRKDLPGYVDDNGTPSVYGDGSRIINFEPYGLCRSSDAIYSRSLFIDGDTLKNKFSSTIHLFQDGFVSGIENGYYTYLIFKCDIPSAGIVSYGKKFGDTLCANYSQFYNNQWTQYQYYFKGGTDDYTLNYTVDASTTIYYCYLIKGLWGSYKCSAYSVPFTFEALGTTNIINNKTITINNNTWNGNIYTDNSTNLTYIYPQYTTINEHNETVTNISNNPIIYNNETKQYYTYDTVTNNYYYITYEQPATPTPSPSSSPSPTPTESGNKGDSGSSGWNPFKWLTDLLKDIVETILKGIWKLITSIFGFILWLLSLLFKLFPWIPNSGILALCAGVVVVTVIRIIKFITGR